MSEFKFGQKGWAWDYDKTKAVEAVYGVLTSEGVNQGAHDCSFICPERGSFDTDYFKNFSLEKPCPFKEGDVVELECGSCITFCGEELNGVKARKNHYWWQFNQGNFDEGEFCIEDTLLYTAEQLGDPANYEVHYSYLDEIKAAYKRGETIQYKNLKLIPTGWSNDHWVDDLTPDWSADEIIFRIKPKPHIEGFDLVEIYKNNEGYLAIGEGFNGGNGLIDSLSRKPNFAGFYYDTFSLMMPYSRMWAHKEDNDAHVASPSKIYNKMVLPTHVAFVKEIER
jgi:hypothetical protein